MFENLSTFARIRIGVLSVIFVGSLALFVTGVPELPRAAADDSAIQPGEGGGECPEGYFCAKFDGTRPACSALQCCGGDEQYCLGDCRLSVANVKKLKSGPGTCWKRKVDKINGCLYGDCDEEGTSCIEGTCSCINMTTLEIYVYESNGTKCPPDTL